MRVLVVDDDPSIRSLLCTQLTEAGEEASAVADGPAALGLLDLTPFDVVVSDLMMPGMSGWDLLTTLRSSPRHSGVPVVLLSARDGRDDVRTGYEHGASAVLAKPYAFDELLLLLRTLSARGPTAHYPQAGPVEPLVVRGLPQL